jgi:energy-coupling factor transporter ATP-binding protein EcfA2
MKSDVSALEVRGLTKRFDRPAVDALDLTIHVGEFYALLGPNGAGKTTTLRMVAGLLRPDAGAISILGIDALNDPIAAKQIMAWVSDEPMSRICTSAAKDFPRACARRWRWPARWYTIPSSLFLTNRSPASMPCQHVTSRDCCRPAFAPAAPSS